MTVTAAISRLLDGQCLTADQAYAVAGELMSGDAVPAQVGALLALLRARGEAVDDIYGFARALRRRMTAIDVGLDSLVDTCGTGGDGRGTFSVSTVSAIVAAGAGCRVAKHGNRRVSSRCGSADLLESLGVPIDLAADEAAHCLRTIGIAFLFAPQFHPALRNLESIRRQLGVRTIFNLVGPLVNPAGVRRQVIGVFNQSLVRTLAEVVMRFGADHVLVVHGADGSDEISILGTTHICEVRGDTIQDFEFVPGEAGVAAGDGRLLAGGSVDENAAIAMQVLRGDRSPARDVTLLNAGAAIYVAGLAESIEIGVRKAARAIDSGAALHKLNQLRQSRRAAAK